MSLNDVSFGVAFGLWSQGMPPVEELVDLATRAEDLGFDAVWLGDHVVLYAPILDPLCVLSAFAMRTRRIRLGTGVLLLPLRPPAAVAKSVGTLDYLSGGRVLLGVGVGGENPTEFAACGVPVKERGARADEAIAILRRLWREDAVTHRGRFWQFDGVTMEPKPVQPSGPPIWVGGRSDAALGRAAMAGDGWIAYLVSPERFKTGLDKIRELAAAKGRELGSFVPAAVLFTSVDDDAEVARQRAAQHLLTAYRQQVDPSAVGRWCVAGTVEQCARRVAEYLRAGARHIIVRPLAAPSEFPASFELAANKLLPLARELHAAGAAS